MDMEWDNLQELHAMTSSTWLSLRNACLFLIVLSTFLLFHLFTSLNDVNDFEERKMSPIRACDCIQKQPSDGSADNGLVESHRRNLYSAKDIDLWFTSAFVEKHPNGTFVQIFGVERRDVVKGEYHCTWSLDGINFESHAKHSIIDATWPHWGPIFACSFTCRIPDGILPPKVINLSSISDGAVKFSNIPVDVGASIEPKKSLAVCVKPMTGPLKVYRLVEWFETMRAVGMEDFILYHTDVTGNGRYALEHYEKLGVLTLVQFPFLYSVLEKVDTDAAKLNGQNRYAVYQQVYLAAMQDCLIRFRNSYTHILFMDLDEILLPTKEESLVQMLARLDAINSDLAGYLFLTAWHFEEFGAIDDKEIDKLYLQKYIESTEPIDNQPKCIVKTSSAATINFHGVLTNLNKDARLNIVVPWKDYGYLHHFRGRCVDKFENKRCDKELLVNHRRDPALLRYRNQTVLNIKKVIDVIQLH